MDRERILDEIRRCAEENAGVAVGKARFEKLTGITEAQWAGRYWVRWSDAVAEAGFAAGAMTIALPDDVLLDALVHLIRELGHYPVAAEFRMKRREDTRFPDHKVFRRFGNKPDLAARVIAHVVDDPDAADVVAICEAVAAEKKPHVLASESAEGTEAGQVYLVKSGTYFKIGRSNSAGRRAYELAIQLPDRLEVVHVIDTDDAVGIERYWHQRFAERRANGTSPGWVDDKFTVGSRVWRWLSYDDLAERVQLAATAIRASRAGEAAFGADLLEHYARFVRMMRQLATAVGEPLVDEGVELDGVVIEHLRRIRLHDALSKARARTLVNVLRRELGDEINGRPVTWKSDFTRGNVLIEAFAPTADGDRVGWQLQGGQWRLAVISGSHAGRTGELRAARHTYVADRYGTWFDFAPVTEVVGPAAVPRAELAGDFNRYDPDFVYRYRPVPRLTVAQLRELARQYQARASIWVS